MSKKNKLKAKFNSIFNKIMKVSDIEKLDYSLKQIEGTYTKVSNDYFECRAEIRYTEKEIEQVKAEITKYENYGRIIASKLDEADNKTLKDLQEKAQNAYTKMNLVNSKLKMLEENLLVIAAMIGKKESFDRIMYAMPDKIPDSVAKIGEAKKKLNKK